MNFRNFPFLSLLLHLSDVWKYGRSQISFLIPSPTLLRGVEGGNSLTEIRIISHSSPVTHSLHSSILLRDVEAWKRLTKSGFL